MKEFEIIADFGEISILKKETEWNLNQKKMIAFRMADEDKYPYYLGYGFDLGFRAKRACQLIDEQIADQKQIDVQFLESMQLDVHDLSAEEMVSGVLKKLNLDQVIKEHPVTPPQWVQFTMNSVIPKVIRDGVEVKVEYYNESVNREKAEYGWKLLSEWDFEYTTESLAATIYEAFILVLIRRVIITGILVKRQKMDFPMKRQ